MIVGSGETGVIGELKREAGWWSDRARLGMIEVELGDRGGWTCMED